MIADKIFPYELLYCDRRCVTLENERRALFVQVVPPPLQHQRGALLLEVLRHHEALVHQLCITRLALVLSSQQHHLSPRHVGPEHFLQGNGPTSLLRGHVLLSP